MSTASLFLHSIEPLHIGDGVSLGDVNLPVRRERITAWPVIDGPSVKGVLKDAVNGAGLGVFQVGRAFGTDDATAVAELIVQDARLLLLPVRTLQYTFMWLSCPMALNRWVRDLADMQIEGLDGLTSWLDPIAADEVVVPVGTVSADAHNKVVIEAFALSRRESAMATQWSRWLPMVLPDEDDWTRQRLNTRFGVVADELFSSITRLATSITTRNALIYDTRTVRDQALFSQEWVLPDTVFAGLIVDGATRTSQGDLLPLLATVLPGALSFGGDTSTGHGVCEPTIRFLR